MEYSPLMCCFLLPCALYSLTGGSSQEAGRARESRDAAFAWGRVVVFELLPRVASRCWRDGKPRLDEHAEQDVHTLGGIQRLHA